MKFDFGDLIAQKDKVVQSYRDKKYQAIVYEEDKIKVFNGQAILIDAHTALVGEQKISGEQILIATGTRPTIPDIDGLDQVPYLTSDLLTSDELLELKELPASLVVVGGGYIALELGQMFHRFGTKVTILERSQVILPNNEPEVSEALTFALRDEGIHLVTEAQAINVLQNSEDEIEIVALVGGIKQSFRAQKLLVATGRKPNTDNVGLDKVGAQLDKRGFVKVNDELQTNVPNMWAAGDVIGHQTESQLATPVGAHDGVIAAKNALTNAHQKVDHRVIPRTIFTDPQVAVVGITDAEANRLGHRCWCNTIPVELVPRAEATHSAAGIAKMVIDDDTHEVLGVSLVLQNAGEVIHEAAMALRFKARLEDFIDMIHVYPTMAEALKIVAISYYKDPTKLSCCAE